MSFVASHIGTVPSIGFRWYLIFLEGSFDDPIRREIDEHFRVLGGEVGESTLVVRGHNPTTFRESVYEAAAFYDDKWYERARFPALLVVDTPPTQALSGPDAMDKARVFIFPLQEIYEEQQTLTGFLDNLLSALKNPAAMEALEDMEKVQSRKRYWGWLNRYVKMEPGIYGFGVNLNKVLTDIAGY
jgi:hypothetical protein